MKIPRQWFILTACAALLPSPPAATADTGFGLSGNVAVDTRTLTMTELTVTGSPSIPLGSEAPFTATLSYQGVPPEDVTTQCEWSVTGGPAVANYRELPFMWGNVLEPKVASPIPLLITARIVRNNGAITSAPFAVTVTESNGMNVGIALVHPTQTGPVYLRPAGNQFVWRIAAETYGAATYAPGVTFQWFLDGQLLDTGRALDAEITGLPGTRQLRVLAANPAGATGQSFWTLVCDAPPGLNEPPVLIPAVDPDTGTLREVDGTSFGFDPAKTSVGLIVLTHGTFDMGRADWIKGLGVAMRERLLRDGKPVPNIVIFDWEKRSTPTEYLGYDAAHDAALQDAESALIGVPILVSDEVVGLVADFLLVRPFGHAEGLSLADWIKTEIGNGHIDEDKPIHLIGHSAGGFVVGEAGWQLRNLCSDLRVTMLDPPFPYFHHLWGYPGSTVEDADQDGLTNAVEVAQGTDPMKADTDGDGLSDAVELSVHLTNPLLADTDGDGSPDGDELTAGTDPKNPASRLAVASMAFAPTGFSLQWTGQASRKYRVLRAPTPDFLNYDVIGAAMPGVSPVQSFLDSTLVPGSVPKMFYKVEIEPAP